MIIPEILFSLPFAKDFATQQIEFQNRYLSITGNATNLFTGPSVEIPKDRIGVIASLGATGQMDALGGHINSVWASAALTGTTYAMTLASTSRGFASGAPVPLEAHAAPVGAFAPPGSVVTAFAAVSAANVAHVIALSLAVITFPRGNFAVS